MQLAMQIFMLVLPIIQGIYCSINEGIYCKASVNFFFKHKILLIKFYYKAAVDFFQVG